MLHSSAKWLVQPENFVLLRAKACSSLMPTYPSKFLLSVVSRIFAGLFPPFNSFATLTRCQGGTRPAKILLTTSRRNLLGQEGIAEQQPFANKSPQCAGWTNPSHFHITTIKVGRFARNKMYLKPVV